MMAIKKLRRVWDHIDIVLPEDHNDHVDNWKEQNQFNRSVASGGADLESLIEQLEDLIATMRKVVMGDYLYADDHNKFVKAWRKQLDIDKILAPDLEEVAKLETIVYRMTEIAPGDIYYADFHNLFAEAWELQEKINTTLLRIPPSMTQIFVEDWSFGGMENLGKLVYEDWGYSEPPEFTVAFYEWWST